MNVFPAAVSHTGVFMKHRALVYCSFLLAFLPGLSACTEEMRGQFGSMFEIRDRLVEEYNHEHVSINIHNGTSLTVTFVNSTFNDMSTKDRKAGAQSVASTTVASLEHNTGIRKLTVAFTQHETRFLIVNYNNSFGSFVFDVPTLMRSLPQKPTITPAQPVAEPASQN